MGKFMTGGVNITGLQLVDHANKTVQQFIDEWYNLDSQSWPGAGVESIEVS